jgi:hypothetical protein
VKDFAFVDKSGINHRDIKKEAWSEKGVKVIRERCAAAHKRTTIIVEIFCKKIMTPFY